MAGLGSRALAPIGADPSATRAAVERALRGRRWELKGLVVEVVLLSTLLLSLAVLVVLLGSIVAEGWSVFAERGTSFLTQGLSADPDQAGVWQGLIGSLMLMGFVVVLAFPLGIAAAIYIEEYAKDTWLARLINTNIRNLAGVPSIVYGLLGLSVFVLIMSGFTGGLTVISGGLTLALLVLPIVILTTAEALRSVPQSIREAGYGVGATKWEVTRSHVLPYAAPGIFTGTILTLARALGETAPLLLVGAISGFFFSSGGDVIERLRGPYTSLPTVIYAWSRLPGIQFKHLTAAAIMVLLVVLLVMNSAAVILRNRYERKW
jgi:phosphate transport system permease protein